MANKQTRRTVSLNRTTYENALAEANARGISLSQLVTTALAEQGIDVGEQAHRPIEHAMSAARGLRRFMRIRADLEARGLLQEKP